MYFYEEKEIGTKQSFFDCNFIRVANCGKVGAFLKSGDGSRSLRLNFKMVEA